VVLPVLARSDLAHQIWRELTSTLEFHRIASIEMMITSTIQPATIIFLLHPSSFIMLEIVSRMHCNLPEFKYQPTTGRPSFVV
jgi:hypothetical protein